MILLSKKPLYQLFEDGELSKSNHELYKMARDEASSKMYKCILATLSEKSFHNEYDEQLSSEYDPIDDIEYKRTAIVIKLKKTILTKLLLTPLIKSNKCYIFAETLVIDGKGNTIIKESHYILFPIQYFEFTNEMFDLNHFNHEEDIKNFLLDYMLNNPDYITHDYITFNVNNSVIRQLAKSFKDVFI